MKKIQLIIALSIPAIASLVSCANDEQLFIDNDMDTRAISYEINVPDTTKVVTESTAIKVARMFMQSESESRAAAKTVESVTPIFDADGTPQMYVVNYLNNQGYVIVSATKDYYPVIAFSDTGHFNMTNLSTEHPAHGWIQDQISSIRSNEDIQEEQRNEIASLWMIYNPTQAYYGETLSRTSREKPRAYFDSIRMWNEQNGVEVYFYKDYILTEEYALLSTEDKRDIQARIHVFGQTEDDNSIIVLRRHLTTQTKFNYINSKWDQIKPYNYLQPDTFPLGCTTVAAGLIMRHHQHPSTFDWAKMPETYCTATTQQFLYNLALNIGVRFAKEESPASTKNLINSLKSYGYNVILKDHSIPNIEKQLSLGNPVIMIGTDPNNGAHSWVCDGYDYFTTATNIYMMSLDYSEAGDIPNEMYVLWSKEGYRHDYGTYHMCWGWGGLYDGFFYDSNIQAGKRNYYKNRKELLISPIK